MEADGADGDDGGSGEYKVSEVVKMVRTCQSLSEQNCTHLGLLLLHTGPNGDGFHLWNITTHQIVAMPGDLGLSHL
jgi:hypothetical protein